MKHSRKILAAALSVLLVGALSAGTVGVASADEATAGHEYDARNDVIFEDFDRDDISDTVTAYGEEVDTGEKPYLRVTYSALTASEEAGDRVSQIYKQGSGSLQNVASSGGTITIRMRAPYGDVSVSDLNFGVRSPSADSDSQVYARSFDTLYDPDGNEMPELTSEWQDYVISFSTSYEDDDVYSGTTYSVTSVDLAGIHIYADDGKEGTVDIAYIMYNSSYLNNFTGGDTVDASGKVADAGFYWAGSTYGYIVKRTVSMTGGQFSVVKTAVGDYKYAIIEAEGDVANLSVATTTDGTTWSDFTAYDGYSVALSGKELGFMLAYNGTESVTVRRIYLTNLTQTEADTMIPLIDASSAQLLDDFSVSQSGFTGVWEDMSTAPELEDAGMEYRLSYNNGSLVEITDGMLVFDGTNLASGDYINFKFKSLGHAAGDYVVFKVKCEDGADLSQFRFALGDPDDAYTDIIYTSSMMAGVQLPVAFADSSNPYATADGWYYIVIDIEESGFAVSEAGYSGLDMYWSGTGTLYIDSIFFADAADSPEFVEEDIAYPDISLDLEAVTDYSYQYMYIDNSANTGTTLSFDITPVYDGFDISQLRLQFRDDTNDYGTFWASENSQGTLITTDGLTLDQLTYAAGETTHVEIDLAASGISGGFIHVDLHRSNIGAFKLDNVVLHTASYDYESAMELFDTYLDNVAPQVSINMSTTATAGDVITVEYTASDDMTAQADLSVTISVTKDGNAVSLSGNSFAAEEGVYTITVTVRDAAGNEASDTIQVTVSAAAGENTEQTDGGAGLSTGAIVGIVIAAVVVVAAIIVAVVIVKRKKSKDE